MSKSQLLKEAIERELWSVDASLKTIGELTEEWVQLAATDSAITFSQHVQRAIQGTSIQSFKIIAEMCRAAAHAALDAMGPKP